MRHASHATMLFSLFSSVVSWTRDCTALFAKSGRPSNILFLSVVVSDFRLLLKHELNFAYHTGHCFCVPCIANWKDAGGSRCPSCRHLIKNDSGHRLYITIRDVDILSSEDEPASDGLSAAVVKQVKYVTKRLDRMDATASLKTVKKAEENLVKLADVLEADGLVEVGRALLQLFQLWLEVCVDRSCWPRFQISRNALFPSMLFSTTVNVK
jgi:hypothetical protein